MSYKLHLSDRAGKERDEYKRSGDRKKLEKIALLFDELEEHPTTGTGKPELLKYDYSGYWSRRIDKKNRIVYEINDKKRIVEIYTMKYHYKK
ncbi:Toxin RelK [termite gut metagenome]|uniref:Putative mRNA interferase YoeB n=1 Tax=termite gut metagenome TaxID=433724 RepID=A0A5J4SWX3_9ZZZZ